MLSILIPAYNYYIFELVEELKNQADRENIDFEIIVADDSPGTPLSIKNSEISILEHCCFIQNPNNLGRTFTRQKLAKAARYATLLFLDADVIPVNKNFISLYLKYAGLSNQVFVGGYAYKPQAYKKGKNLRYKYGVHREQKMAQERNKSAYGNIFSGNFMINKEVFLNNNYADEGNYYGMDIYFGYKLYINKVDVIHIDNPIYHLGLENDSVFFKKCLESVKSRKLLLENTPGSEKINSLLRYYKILKKYHLKGVATLSFKISAPLLKKMILKKDPNLFCLDLYRLGYLCSLK